ncbi:hypothetical protein KI387_016163, partial [Taxus chinensis]
ETRMRETRGSGEMERECTKAFGTIGMKMREVRGSGISAEIGTAGPFGLGDFWNRKFRSTRLGSFGRKWESSHKSCGTKMREVR